MEDTKFNIYRAKLSDDQTEGVYSFAEWCSIKYRFTREGWIIKRKYPVTGPGKTTAELFDIWYNEE
jgi:hypothetical protein